MCVMDSPALRTQHAICTVKFGKSLPTWQQRFEVDSNFFLVVQFRLNPIISLSDGSDYPNKCKKLQFIHKLTASDTSKTANITKRWYYPPAHRLNVNVLLSNITFFVIFAVLDVSLAVNLCINYSFFHLYLQFYYISELLQQNCLFGLPSQIIRPNRVVD